MAKISYSDIPSEVLMVWMLEYTKQPVGMEMWNRCKVITEKYPQYFGEDHYKDLKKYHEEQERLKEIRNKRNKEMWDELDKLFNFFKNDTETK